MSIDFGDAVDYPLRGEETVKLFGVMAGIPVVLAIVSAVVAFLSLVVPVLGFLNLFMYPVGLAVGVLWLGYFVRVVQSTFAGESEPPPLDDWAKLLKDGLYGTVIYLVYSIPLFVVAGLGIVTFVALVGGLGTLGSESESAGATLGLVALLAMLVLGIVYFVWTLVMGYLFPVSLCSYADEERFTAAFSVDRLSTVALQADYAVPWLAVAAVAFVTQMAIGTLTAVLIGYLLYPFVPILYFYLGTAAFYVFASVYDESVDAPAAEATARAPRPSAWE